MFNESDLATDAADKVAQWLGKLLEAEEAGDDGRRRVCQAAIDGQAEPEALRQALRRRGVAASLAGEIKLVLMCEAARDAFLRQEPVTWSAALKLAWDYVAAEIQGILAGDPGETIANQGRIRRLCELGHEWGLDPETYRRQLVRAGLTPSRASEIKTVLGCPKICQRFVRQGSDLSWEAALSEARKPAQDELALAGYAQSRAARKLVRLVVEHWEDFAGAGGLDSTGQRRCQVVRESSGCYVITHAEAGEFTLVPKTYQFGDDSNPGDN